jgi:hypothetical protein
MSTDRTDEDVLVEDEAVDAARLERERVILAEAEADIAAGRVVRWSEFRVELLERDRQIRLDQGLEPVTEA